MTPVDGWFAVVGLTALVAAGSVMGSRWAMFTDRHDRNCRSWVWASDHLQCATVFDGRCGPVQAGDAVVTDGPTCRRVPAGMPSRARRAVGLPINLNDATELDLQWVEGIGPSLAKAIVAHRTDYGPFTSIGDLEAVKGVGPVRRELLSTSVIVGPSPTAP